MNEARCVVESEETKMRPRSNEITFESVFSDSNGATCPSRNRINVVKRPCVLTEETAVFNIVGLDFARVNQATRGKLSAQVGEKSNVGERRPEWWDVDVVVHLIGIQARVDFSSSTRREGARKEEKRNTFKKKHKIIWTLLKYSSADPVSARPLHLCLETVAPKDTFPSRPHPTNKKQKKQRKMKKKRVQNEPPGNQYVCGAIVDQETRAVVVVVVVVVVVSSVFLLVEKVRR